MSSLLAGLLKGASGSHLDPRLTFSAALALLWAPPHPLDYLLRLSLGSWASQETLLESLARLCGPLGASLGLIDVTSTNHSVAKHLVDVTSTIALDRLLNHLGPPWGPWVGPGGLRGPS